MMLLFKQETESIYDVIASVSAPTTPIHIPSPSRPPPTPLCNPNFQSKHSTYSPDIASRIQDFILTCE